MGYFKNVEKGNIVFGLIFGKGVVSNNQLNGHYTLLVDFDNGYQVPYTEEGVPSWGQIDYQTLFYKKDIDITEIDFSPIKEELSPKKIIKLREKKLLNVKCPSGLWKPIHLCPVDYIENLVENEQFWMFKKFKQ